MRFQVPWPLGYGEWKSQVVTSLVQGGLYPPDALPVVLACLSPSYCWGSAISVPYLAPLPAPAIPWMAVQSPLTPELIYSRAFGNKTSSHHTFPCATWIFCSCTRRAVFWIWTWIGPLLCHFLTLGQTLSSLNLNFFITRIGSFMLPRTCKWPSVWGLTNELSCTRSEMYSHPRDPLWLPYLQSFTNWSLRELSATPPHGGEAWTMWLGGMGVWPEAVFHKP